MAGNELILWMDNKEPQGEESSRSPIRMVARNGQPVDQGRPDQSVCVTLTTDGSCRPNPGPGGWSCILRYTSSSGREFLKELSGGEAETTNNRMEMTAVIQGLEALKKPCRVTVLTDSQLVIGGMTGWTRGKNLDLWERLDKAASSHAIEWCFVKGHAGHDDNERCDRLAGREAQIARRGPASEKTQETPAEADAAS